MAKQLEEDPLYSALRGLARLEDGGRTRRHERAQLGALPAVAAAVQEHHHDLSAAATAALETGVQALSAVESKTEGLMVGDVAAAALALGAWRDVAGLGNRLLGVAGDDGPRRSTMRSRMREALLALAEVLPTLRYEDLVFSQQQPQEGVAPRVDKHYLLRHTIAGRVPRTSLVEHTLLATAEAITSHEARGHYPNDRREEAFEIRPLSNCQSLTRRPSGSGMHRYVLRVPKTPPGQTVWFSFEYHVASPAPDLPYLLHWSPNQVERATLSIQFEPGDLPQSLWYFTNQDSWYDPMDRPPRSFLLNINSVGFCQVELGAQKPDEMFGFGWSWAR